MKLNRFRCSVILLMILSTACNLTGVQVNVATPVPTVTSTAQVLETPVVLPPVETETPQPPIVFDGKLNCVPAGTFTKCLDGLLRIEYEYPTVWGQITANLQSGLPSMTGSAYEYSFDGNKLPDSTVVLAGGRSKDFSMGRGGMPTDFFGYIPGDPDQGASCTASWHKQYALCENLDPNLTWMISFPDAAMLCEASGGPGFSPTPVFRLEINLPENPTIHGFVWQAPFISEQFSNQLKSELYPLLELDSFMGAVNKCDAESQQKFDAQRAIYLEQIKNKSVEAGTQKNLDELFHLLNSTIFH